MHQRITAENFHSLIFCRNAVKKAYKKKNNSMLTSKTTTHVLASVLYSIDALSKEHNPSHVMVLNEYIGDVRMTSAGVLYECVIADLVNLDKERKLRGSAKNDFNIAIILASK